MASAREPLYEWICVELCRLLKLASAEEAQELASYIMGFEERSDLEEYIPTLFGPFRKGSGPSMFVETLLRRWRPPARKPDAPSDGHAYRKDHGDVAYMPTRQKPSKSSAEEAPRSGQNGKVSPVLRNQPAKTKGESSQGAVTSVRQPPPGFPTKDKERKQETRQTSRGGSRSQFVPLSSTYGQARVTVQLTGRHGCGCEARRHKLINNCTKCGRIVCEQEGAGPCFFCGELVCSPADQEVLARNSKKSQKLYEKLMNVPRGSSPRLASSDDSDSSTEKTMAAAGLEKARVLKERLLEYDRTSVQRTKVIDDESDYFTADTNTWLAPADRHALQKRYEELHEARHASRRDRKITFDFAGRRVIEDAEFGLTQSDALYSGQDEVLQSIQGRHQDQESQTALQSNVHAANSGNLSQISITNPLVDTTLEFVSNSRIQDKRADSSRANEQGGSERKRLRLQNRDLREMSDEGMCLSMHQPWASLLVCGIKRVEGRTWYTPHRGLLWIASTAKHADGHEITFLEQSYQAQYPGGHGFPKGYPSGCLLGCVHVVDCLTQEQYREEYPNGESESPFVWIVQSPQQLVVQFPVKGKHKIWKLEKHIHQAAKRCLRAS